MPESASGGTLWAAVNAFEDRLRSDPDTDLGRYLPPPGDPDRLALLTELVRLDLECGWARGRPRPPRDYFTRFPELRSDPAAAAAVAFEDYRVRRLGGEPVTPEAYARDYAVDTAGWPVDPSAEEAASVEVTVLTPPPRAELHDYAPTNVVVAPGRDDGRVVRDWLAGTDAPDSGAAVAEVERSNPEAIRGWSAAIAALPPVGSRFLGFELVDELGRGAFGRVYLARQSDLAARSVALKVGRGLFRESQTLAQLQHTNIVPIYSAHAADPLQAVCMPFFGRLTLAHLVRTLRDRGPMPETGHQLLNTLRRGRTITRAEGEPTARTRPEGEPPSAPPAEPTPPAAAPPAPGQFDDRGAWAVLRDLSYPDAVAWIGSQIAAGLDHAHTQGIIHRDLKPANVLLTDAGVPMLLDFNISEDLKLRGSATTALVGGTLPYMAPEQLEAYAGRSVATDPRADVYALGVILFELLTGERPFPDRVGETAPTIAAMLADRRPDPPRVRGRNPGVPPAVESVVRKCLQADPGRRYQSARDLREDLERHLNHLPLRFAPNPSLQERARKWGRRHPILTSSTSVAAVAVALLLSIGTGAYAARERSRSLEARVALADHAADVRTLQVMLDERYQTRATLDEGIAGCRRALERYGVPTDRDEPHERWAEGRLVRYLGIEDQSRLRDDLGELFYMMARASARKAELAADPADKAADLAAAERWNRHAAALAAERIPRAVREQRAGLAKIAGRTDEADRWRKEAEGTPIASPRDRYLLGYWHYNRGRIRQAVDELTAATAADPQNFSAWFVRGQTHLALEQNDLAAASFTACVALRADFAPAWLNRGLALQKLRKFDLALADFDEASRLEPGKYDPQIRRGGAFQAAGRYKDAVEAFTAALACPGCPTRVYFYRAYSREKVGDKKGAAADRAEGLAQEPTDYLSFVARAEGRLPADPSAALADVERALKLNRLSAEALQLKAHLLSERLNDPEGSLAALNQAIEVYPDHVTVRVGRGVLLARMGKRAEAHRDAEEALLRDTSGITLYMAGCVYALTSKDQAADRLRAVELIAAALRAGFGREHLPTDPDLDPIRKSTEFQRLVGGPGK
jgi:serine/threonine protein kinase/tetratricopeptide (TPR) repeat protein